MVLSQLQPTKIRGKAILRILGVESSCDETAVAVVENGSHILSSKVASQIAIHAPFGGVVPEIAARAHLANIDVLARQALLEAKTSPSELDAIAVTQGPGLIGALLVGAAYSKGLALSLGVPLIPVDHVEAHVHGALLGLKQDVEEIFPCLSLVISGGHTNLYFMKSPTQYRLLAHSSDDACGECFDKVAKLLGLGYPGGPSIEVQASRGNPHAVPMPTMGGARGCMTFSYSGLKTHMVHVIKSLPTPMTAEKLADVCASFQDEALGQIVRKAKEAARLYPEAKSFLVAGGVAANQRLRHLLEKAVNLSCLYPPLEACSDNAAMIAAYGYHQYRKVLLENHESQDKPFLNHRWESYSRYNYSAVLS